VAGRQAGQRDTVMLFKNSRNYIIIDICIVERKSAVVTISFRLVVSEINILPV
jgi:hypothetical protein